MLLLDASGLAASRPGRPLFADLSVTVSSGDHLAVVGLNGCGKSTLLRQLAGLEQPEAGVVRRGRGTRVVVLGQTVELSGATAAEAAGAGWEVAAVLDRLGMGDRLHSPIDSLSGGEAKRVALARALVEIGPPGEADDDVVLMLDEPTNHLDIHAIAWLEERLAFHRGGLILVSHDRHVLDRVTTRILELDRGRAHVHEGGYASYSRLASSGRRTPSGGRRSVATWPGPSWPGCVAAPRPVPESPAPGSSRRRPSSRAAPRPRPGRPSSTWPSAPHVSAKRWSSSAGSATGSKRITGCSGGSTWLWTRGNALPSPVPTAPGSRR